MIKRKVLLILLGLSGFIPLLALGDSPPDPVLLTYSIFVLAFFLQRPLIFLVHVIPLPASFKFVLLITAVSLVSLEFFSWWSEYLRCRENPGLLHPQLIPDLILGIGFYTASALAWLGILRTFKFSLLQVFITQGFYGLAIEGEGAVFLQGLTAMPLGLFLWLYVFLVYAAPGGISYLFIGIELNQGLNRNHWFKYPVTLILLYISTFIVTFIWGAVVQGLQLIPEPRPICEYPFW